MKKNSAGGHALKSCVVAACSLSSKKEETGRGSVPLLAARQRESSERETYMLSLVLTTVAASRAQRSSNEQLAAGVLVGSAAGGASFAAVRQIKTSYFPGGMAYRPLLRPRFSVSQQAAVAAGVALASGAAALDRAWRRDPLGQGLRRLGSAPLDATERMRRKWREARQRAEEERRRAWLREHTRPARVMIPS